MGDKGMNNLSYELIGEGDIVYIRNNHEVFTLDQPKIEALDISVHKKAITHGGSDMDGKVHTVEQEDLTLGEVKFSKPLTVRDFNRKFIEYKLATEENLELVLKHYCKFKGKFKDLKTNSEINALIEFHLGETNIGSELTKLSIIIESFKPE